MSQTDWIQEPLRQAATLIMGQSPDSRFYNASGDGMPFLQGCAQFGKTSPNTGVFCSLPVKVAPAGSILFSVRAPVGAINSADQRYCIGRGLAAVVGKTVETEYLRHYLLFLGTEFERVSQGSTFSAINSTELGVFPVTYPKHRSAQAQIAQVLATLELALAQTDALLAKQQRVKTGLMQELLTRGVDVDGALRPARGSGFVLYPGWETRRLDEVAEVASGITLGRKLSGANTLTLPYLRVFNVQDGYLDLSDLNTVTIRADELARYRLQTGDVLMNEGGDFDKLGRGAVWEGQIDPCLHQNHVFRVRTNRKIMLPEFLAMLSASAYGKAFFVLNSKQSTNLASINSTQLKSFPVPCPDLKEQERILEVVQEQDRLQNDSQRQQRKLTKLKAGLMQDLLTGRVSVAPLLDGSTQP